MKSLRERVESFLYEEAALADAHAHDQWLALWAHDARYFIPCNDDATDPEVHVAIVYEDRAGLEDRMKRQASAFNHSQTPRTRLSRLIGNVQVSEAENDLIRVSAVFNLTAFRRNEQQIYAGRLRYVLRPEGERLLIVEKTVYLINNDGYLGNMTFLI